MILKKFSKDFYTSLIITVLIFILDRISKNYVIGLSNEDTPTQIFSSKFLNINLIWNDGIAFGLFSFESNHLYNILTIIILIVILLVFIMLINSKSYKKYALTMILGGAIGNFYDRIIYKAVPDFIDFHIGEFHWFIFNLADIFITLGVIFMISLEFIGINNKNHEKN